MQGIVRFERSQDFLTQELRSGQLRNFGSVTALPQAVTLQPTVDDINLHYLEDPELWELWYVPCSGKCKIYINSRITKSLNPSLNLKAIMPNRSHCDSRPYNEYEHLF